MTQAELNNEILDGLIDQAKAITLISESMIKLQESVLDLTTLVKHIENNLNNTNE